MSKRGSRNAKFLSSVKGKSLSKGKGRARGVSVHVQGYSSGKFGVSTGKKLTTEQKRKILNDNPIPRISHDERQKVKERLSLVEPKELKRFVNRLKLSNHVKVKSRKIQIKYGYDNYSEVQKILVEYFRINGGIRNQELSDLEGANFTVINGSRRRYIEYWISKAVLHCKFIN